MYFNQSMVAIFSVTLLVKCERGALFSAISQMLFVLVSQGSSYVYSVYVKLIKYEYIINMFFFSFIMLSPCT